MTMRRCLAIFAAVMLLSSCGQKMRVSGQFDSQPEIFPDYKDVTIPCNIAPMNFEFMGKGESRLLLILKVKTAIGENDSENVKNENNYISS